MNHQHEYLDYGLEEQDIATLKQIKAGKRRKTQTPSFPLELHD